jgi:hypothetical protein
MNYHATPATGPIPLTPAFIAFYATTATVIPVLFLAIAVQGSAYQSMLNSVVRVARSSLGAGPLRRRVGRMGRLLLFLIPYLILLLTVGGECLIRQQPLQP